VDIIIMIILARYMGKIAASKGEPVSKWRWRVILNWLALEIAGFALSMMIVQNLYLNAIFALFCGFGGYLIVKSRLDQIPDKDDWADHIGE
jgi:purine-cytosine permease-like protein